MDVVGDVVLNKFIWDHIIDQSDSSSSSDEDVTYLVTNLAYNARQNSHRIEYVEPEDDAEFQKDFRLTREAFNFLLERLEPMLKGKSLSKEMVDPKIAVLVTIWILSTPDSYRSISKQFQMAKSSAWVCFERVVNALCDISHEFIKWPSHEERNLKESAFNRKSQIKEIIGAVDGTYIPIKAPTESPEVYINRKCCHGITLQAVCDQEKTFMDIFVGYPSSVSDRRIFSNSELFHNVTEHCLDYFDPNQFIIGDKAYPTLNWIISPYIDRGNLADYQKNFNKCQSSARSIIERSFALLFGRFRRLKYLDMSRMDLIPKTVLAASVLHNVCLMFRDTYEERYVEEGYEFLRQGNAENANDNELIVEAEIEGTQRRENIARNLRIV